MVGKRCTFYFIEHLSPLLYPVRHATNTMVFSLLWHIFHVIILAQDFPKCNSGLGEKEKNKYPCVE